MKSTATILPIAVLLCVTGLARNGSIEPAGPDAAAHTPPLARHAAMTDYVRHHARQVARLVETLEAVPDAGGGSVMDNTLIVWGSELGDGWHGYSHYNPVLIGGSWAFRTGRYLYWPHETPVQMRVPSLVAPGGRTRFAGVPHQRLLVSVARAMGIDIDHVGLRQVRGQRGDFVNVAGPLDGLTA